MKASLPADVTPHIPNARDSPPRVSVGKQAPVTKRRPATAPRPAPLKWGVREHALPACLTDPRRWEDSSPAEAGALLAALAPRRGSAPRSTRGPLDWQVLDSRPQCTADFLLDESGCRQCQVSDESSEDVFRRLQQEASAALAEGAHRFRSAVASPNAIGFHARGSYALPKEAAMGPPGAGAGREFAHIHGKYRTPACCRSAAWGPPRIDPAELKGEGQGSMHVCLSLPDAAAVVAAGWGIWHDAAGEMERHYRLPRGYVLVYAPRDRSEVDVAVSILRAALKFAQLLWDPLDGWGVPPD